MVASLVPPCFMASTAFLSSVPDFLALCAAGQLSAVCHRAGQLANDWGTLLLIPRGCTHALLVQQAVRGSLLPCQDLRDSP